MSRTGIVSELMHNGGHSERNLNLDASAQLSMFEIWDKVDDTHETTYQLISPEGDIIDLTFTTNDRRAFDKWCREEGLNPEKIHSIANEGLNTSHKDWFVKIIDNPVIIPEEQPEPVVEEKPKRKPRKRKAKAKTKAKAAAPKKPRKRKIKTKEQAAEVLKEIAEATPITFEEPNEKIPNVWEAAEEVQVPVNRKQRRAAKKRSKRKG